MKLNDISEGVAGPKNCWPGHRKIGTQPGTGKNAGKRVNKCKKIGEDIDIADQGEYDQEGGMAIGQLKTAEDAAAELQSILDSDENLPEWVQAKITKAVDYLDTARDYMKSKEQGVAEAGPFSYGAKKPRRGSVAYNAMMKRREQEKNRPPIEPKDQMVGTAKLTKDVSETSDYFRRREREEAIISGQKPARKKQPAQTSDYARRREQEKKAEKGVAEGSLSEIDRRGFLKGLGIAAGSATAPAYAATWQKKDLKDPMTDKSSGRWNEIKADNGNAKLIIHEYPGPDHINDPKKTIIYTELKLNVPGQILSFTYFPSDRQFYAPGRIKIGNTVQEFYLNKVPNSSSTGWSEDKKILNQLSKYTGPVKIEIPIARIGKVIFDFTLDNTPERLSSKVKQQGVAEGGQEADSDSKVFTVVYYSPRTDRTATKKIRASSESEVWDRLSEKGIDVVSVRQAGVTGEQGVVEGSGSKYKVKSIGKDSKGDYYISPSTGKKVYKSGVNKGDHENPKTGEIKKGVDEAKVLQFPQQSLLDRNLIVQLKSLAKTRLELSWEGPHVPSAYQGQAAQMNKQEYTRMTQNVDRQLKALGYEWSENEEDFDILYLHSIAREKWYDSGKPMSKYRGLPDLMYNADTNTLSEYDLIGDEESEYDNPKQFEGMSEAYDPWDEGDMWYRFDPDSGLLKQRMWKHAQERDAKTAGWSQTQARALQRANIIRSKFDQNKFVQKQGKNWVQVFPYGKK